MEKLRSFYQIELWGRMDGPSSTVDLMSVKLGSTFEKIPKNRGIESEFIKTINGSTDPTFVRKTIENEETVLDCRGPESIVKPFEKWIHEVYMDGAPKTFPHITARQEYYNPSPSSYEKMKCLRKVGKSFSSELEGLEKRYLELIDTQALSIAQITAEYAALFDRFKRKLFASDLSKKRTSTLAAAAVPLPAVQPVGAAVQQAVLKNAYDEKVLLTDFILYIDEKQNTAYLQGKTYHRHVLKLNDAPENPWAPTMRHPFLKKQKSWIAKIEKSTRFQWHDSKWASNYSPKNPVTLDIIVLFKTHGIFNINWFDVNVPPNVVKPMTSKLNGIHIQNNVPGII